MVLSIPELVSSLDGGESNGGVRGFGERGGMLEEDATVGELLKRCRGEDDGERIGGGIVERKARGERK